MQREEFTELTGIYPSMILYRAIEQEYMESGLDKVEFCRRYILNVDGLAEKIQVIADEEVFRQETKIERLQIDLDAELKWVDCPDVGTSLSQVDYLKMSNGSEPMLDDEAKDLMSVLFGFMIEKIKIRHETHEYEINKYKQTRVTHTFRRFPIWNNPDNNYIRFDCAGKPWEFVNGKLIPYDRR